MAYANAADPCLVCMRSRSAPRQSTYRESRFCIIKALQTTLPEGANGNKEVFVSPKETFRYSSFVIRHSLFVIRFIRTWGITRSMLEGSADFKKKYKIADADSVTVP